LVVFGVIILIVGIVAVL